MVISDLYKNQISQLVPKSTNFEDLQNLCKTKNIEMKIQGSDIFFKTIAKNVMNPIE